MDIGKTVVLALVAGAFYGIIVQGIGLLNSRAKKKRMDEKIASLAANLLAHPGGIAENQEKKKGSIKLDNSNPIIPLTPEQREKDKRILIIAIVVAVIIVAGFYGAMHLLAG